jgi:hypothetical protein
MLREDAKRKADIEERRARFEEHRAMAGRECHYDDEPGLHG